MDDPALEVAAHLESGVLGLLGQKFCTRSSESVVEAIHVAC